MDPGSDTFEIVEPESDGIDVDAAYQQHADSLQWFLRGVLKNDTLVADAVQATFLKLLQQGDKLREKSSLKSWLFQVAYNEAMLVKRKDKTVRDHGQQVAWRTEAIRTEQEAPDFDALKSEQSQLVCTAIESLSQPQQVVVRMRIYEGLKFREIAERLDVPIGTILARMQSALKKLKPFFD